MKNKIKKEILNNKWLYLVMLFEVSFLISMNIYLLVSKRADSTLVFAMNIISLFATTFGVISNLLAINKKISNYYFSFVNILLYAIVSFSLKIYGDFALNLIFYIPTSIWGLLYWRKLKKNHNENRMPSPKKLKIQHLLVVFLITAISIPTFGYLLMIFDDPAPFLDSASTVLSIIGMFLAIRYYREQWYFWILVNLISICIYIVTFSKNPTEVTSILYIIMWSMYFLNSLFGFIIWSKRNKKFHIGINKSGDFDWV